MLVKNFWFYKNIVINSLRKFKQMKKSILILIFVVFAFINSFPQDSLAIQKYDKKKFKYGFAFSLYSVPKTYNENHIILNDKNKISFGLNFLVNYNITKKIGVSSGLELLLIKKAFDYIFINNDTIHFEIGGIYLNMPVNFLLNTCSKRKINYFYNIGLTPSYVNTSTYYQKEDNNWPKPSSMNCRELTYAFNMNIGLKLHLYKSINYFVMFSYNYYHNKYFISPIDKGVKIKNAFLKFNMGLFF